MTGESFQGVMSEAELLAKLEDAFSIGYKLCKGIREYLGIPDLDMIEQTYHFYVSGNAGTPAQA